MATPDELHTAHLHATQGLTPENSHGWVGEGGAGDVRLAPGRYQFAGGAAYRIELLQAVPVDGSHPFIQLDGDTLVISRPVEIRIHRGRGILNLTQV